MTAMASRRLDRDFTAQQILIMVRARIQLPDALYREVKRIANQQEWSVTEVIRRGAETMARLYPPVKDTPTAKCFPPAPINARLRVSDPAALKALIRDDTEAI
jgi:hypothetical protein